MISSLPARMNTLIIQQGNEFPQTLVARILIARAVATKPKILFIDGFDSCLEPAVQKQILKIMKIYNIDYD